MVREWIERKNPPVLLCADAGRHAARSLPVSPENAHVFRLPVLWTHNRYHSGQMRLEQFRARFDRWPWLVKSSLAR